MDQDTSLTTEDLLDAWNLSEYKSVFTEHKITLDTLSALNEELIKELILPIGDHFIKKLADWKELADTLQEKHSPSIGTSIVQDSDDSVTVMKIRHSTTQEFQNVFQSNISPVKVRDYNAAPLFASENASSEVWGAGGGAGGGGSNSAACGSSMDLKHELAYRSVLPGQVKAEPGVSHNGVSHPANGHVRDWMAGGGAGGSPSPGASQHPANNGYSSPLSSSSYGPYSPNGKIGREELSPASSVNGCSTDRDARRQKKGPAPRQQEELCLVCGDRASGYHYNALTCEGCKGFFRRSVTKNAVYICKFGHGCEMDMYMRRKCQECRLKKCLAVGMRPECVVPETTCEIKRKEKKAQREKDKLPVSTTTVDDHMPPIMQCDPPPPEAARIHEVVPRFLSDKLLEQNRQKNIPPLTANQQCLIARLVWYQDGYEQPSEEDLKRITQTWQQDKEEEDTDMPFRQITEMTILTVQLIVEFAKGLPGFSKISQPDQITLLKACSSEVMMLRVSRSYDAATDSVLFANNRSYTRESYHKAGLDYVIEELLHFCRCMYAMSMDNVHYALLTAIVIFSDRPGLEQPQLVEEIQRYYLNTLRVYILNQNSGSARCPVVYGRILSILSELRTLGMQNSNMCISLKLKNRKLPPFLEEIWDVADVSNAQPPPPVKDPTEL